MLEAAGIRRVRAAFAIAMMAFALNGCLLHRKAQPFALPPFTPVALAQVPEPADPAMIETDDDDEDLPPVPMAEGASVPKRQRRKVVVVKTPTPDAVPVAQPPTQVATSTPPATESESASVIGDLTPGGDQDPKTQREASDLIAANEKRLSALSADTVRNQAALVSNVRNFQKQAQQALKTGDAAGAKTLATKGKLLLDELETPGG